MKIFSKMSEESAENPRKPAQVVFDALLKTGVVKSLDDLTPEMLELMKETNEGKALLEEADVPVSDENKGADKRNDR